MTIDSDYGLYTATFTGINDKEEMDLTDIVALTDQGQSFDAGNSKTRCNGLILINKVSTNGNYGVTYKYYEAGSKLGWYSNSTYKVQAGEVKFRKGEAFLINNTYKTNNIPQKIVLRSSGNVAIKPFTLIETGYSLYGNFTPNEIDLNDIIMRNREGASFDAGNSKTRCNGLILINKIKPNGNYDYTYKFYEAGSKLGWYSNSTIKVERGIIKFKPGESLS